MTGRWVAAAVVVPVLLSLGVSVGTRDEVEADLRARTTDALARAGIARADVRFDGVQGTVSLSSSSLPSGVDVRGVQQVLAGVDGAHRLTLDVEAPVAPSPTPSPTPAPAPDPCAAPQASVDTLLGPDRVAFGNAGAVLAGAELTQVQQAASLLVACGAAVTVVGHTADRAPEPSTLAQDRAVAVAGVLSAAGVTVVSALGDGSADPLGDNATVAGRRLNRYADIRVQ